MEDEELIGLEAPESMEDPEEEGEEDEERVGVVSIDLQTLSHRSAREVFLPMAALSCGTRYPCQFTTQSHV